MPVATSGSATASATGSGGSATNGDASGTSGYNTNSQTATGGSGTGTGGAGGSGGSIALNAGTFNLSNTMSSVGQSAAGITAISQNSGISSLIQQSVNVQANLAPR